MANNKVKHYRTDVAGRKPEAKNMLDGEIAINLADKKIFTKFGDAVINIGNGADAVVSGGQTFTGKIKASDIESDSNLKLKNADKSDIVFADEHDKAKVRISSPAQTDAKGELRVTVAKGKATGESSDFVLNGNGQLSLPAAPVTPESATRKDYVDSEIAKVQSGSNTSLSNLEKKVNDNNTAINTRVDNLNGKVDTLNSKVDANDTKQTEAIAKIKADQENSTGQVNDRVKRSGDTMTGALTVPNLHVKNPSSAGSYNIVNSGLSKNIETVYWEDAANYVETNRIAGGPIFKETTIGKNGVITTHHNGETVVDSLKVSKGMVLGSPALPGLGDNSITIGDSDTGIKWVQDGTFQLWTDYRAVATFDKGQNNFNSIVQIRHRNYNGTEAEPMPNGSSMLVIDSDKEASLATHFSYNNNGATENYIRGTGMTFIESTRGLTISGEVYAKNQINSNPSYGVYGWNSMPQFNAPDQQMNYLRRFRANGPAVWWHEVAIATHTDKRFENSISLFTGGGRDVWIQSIQANGNLRQAGKIISHGGGNAFQLEATSASSAYVAGNLDGRMNAWVLGKTDANSNLVLQNSMYNDVAKNTAFILGDAQLHTTVGGNSILKAYNNRLEVDGARWAATNSHSWSDQWKQPAPIMLNMGKIRGGSDYYPLIEQRSIANEDGYNTSVQFGTLRSTGKIGDAIIRVATFDYEPSKSQQATYSFDINGKFTTSSLLAAGKILVGGGTGDGLPGPSITLGDSDTGIRWNSDGVWTLWANAQQVCVIESNGFRTEGGKSLTTYGDLNQASDSHSTYVRDIFVRSDIRVKTDLQKFESPSETLRKIDGYLYKQKKGFKEDGSINWEQSAGLIAQEVQDVLPELITIDKESDEKLLRLNYNGIIALNTATINEHTDEIKLLKNEIKELKKIINK